MSPQPQDEECKSKRKGFQGACFNSGDMVHPARKCPKGKGGHCEGKDTIKEGAREHGAREQFGKLTEKMPKEIGSRINQRKRSWPSAMR